ncbi:glutaredoxin 3 [Paraburkholderia oxyphila]|uniref:glutaredoxin 3 n=1 Tax=Paraburkholderia oxyphila TaxID=614212 RepID=UPI0004829058|nr:glutaredoxin 3 [Paraburkholderia oxyphila]
MSSITIYTKPTCPYCVAAKSLLEEKGARYTEVRVNDNPALAKAVREQTGRHTVPQIFIGEYHVGGYDDLRALDDDGGLVVMLAGLKDN